MKRRITLIAAACLGAGAAGCAEAVAPGAAGGSSEMRVGIRGDQPSTTDPQRSISASETGESEARIEVEARVYVQAEGEGWIELTRGTARQTVDASGRDGVQTLASAQVDARSYRRVRIEFERVEAKASGAAQIGTGLVSGTFRVDGGSDGRVSVEREVRVEARSGGTAELEIDLNADQWYGGREMTAGTAGEAEFQGAVRVVAR